MAIVVTSKGTNSANAASVAVSSLTIVAGSSIIVCLSCRSSAITLVYNDGADSYPLTQRITRDNSGRYFQI